LRIASSPPGYAECPVETGASSPDKIGILALEAEFRGMSISAFISELITSTVKNDLFRQVLDPEITGRTPAGQPILG
jgi:hypothetical protein